MFAAGAPYNLGRHGEKKQQTLTEFLIVLPAVMLYEKFPYICLVIVFDKFYSQCKQGSKK